jgi:hypothetical protein
MPPIADSPDEKTYPVANWATACNLEHDAVFMRFDYLERPVERMEQSQRGKTFALSRDQARRLVSDIEAQLDRLESGIPPSSLAE